MTISLNQILPIKNQQEYKIHLASKDKDAEPRQPLDAFVQDRKKWESWNSQCSSKNDFKRKYIFSMIDFYHEKDIWLFGGIYEVLSTKEEVSSKDGEPHKLFIYDIKPADNAEKFIGRLKISFRRPSRQKSLLPEGEKGEEWYKKMTVSEILKEQYAGEKFCGYENINHEFGKLEAIFNNQRLDWKTALENVNGVYAIHDTSNGKKYIGAAYSDEGGVWKRWLDYMETGHGGNKELIDSLKTEGKESKESKDYARENFVFSLLEYRPMSTDKKTMDERETHWKKILLSRDFGYNKN